MTVTSTQQRADLERPVVEASARGARDLADAYWEEIRQLTLGAVRVRPEQDGIGLVLVRMLPLLRFAAPQISASPDRVECRFPITGGVLAKRSGGSLSITQDTAGAPELIVTVEDYAPRLDSGHERGGLRSFAYRHFQQRAHAAIGRRYLDHMTGRGR